MMPTTDTTTPCLYRWAPYAVLIEGYTGDEPPAHARALQAAADMCETCPVRRRCLGDEYAAEPWAKAVRRVLVRRAKAAA